MTDHTEAGGMVPSQWLVRILGLAVLITAAVALVGSLDDIKRYARMKRM